MGPPFVRPEERPCAKVDHVPSTQKARASMEMGENFRVNSSTCPRFARSLASWRGWIEALRDCLVSRDSMSFLGGDVLLLESMVAFVRGVFLALSNVQFFFCFLRFQLCVVLWRPTARSSGRVAKAEEKNVRSGMRLPGVWYWRC